MGHPDDPTGHGFMSSPVRWTGRGEDGRDGPGAPAHGHRERGQAPHPDDPEGKGFHGTKADIGADENAARLTRMGIGRMPWVGEPENAAPAPTAITNEQEAA